MHNKRIAGALTAVAMMTAAACSGGSESAATTTEATTTTAASTTTTSTTTTTEPKETTTTTEVPTDDSIRQPLTGEIVDSEADLITRPALVVKIDNNDGSARPNHSGLAVADIVFEEIIEAEDTRFAAVFHTQDSEPVGPIRSGREQDVALLSGLNAPLFAWSGGNPGVTRLIRDSFLTDLNAGFEASDAYFRGPGRGPHDLYSKTQDLYAFTPADHPGAPLRQFEYVWPDDEFVGEQVVDVDMSLRSKDIRWEWDAEAGTFARYQEGTRHVDVVHGDIFATNVVVMVSSYGKSSIDNRSPEAETVGSGPVYVFSNGQVVTGRWQRSTVLDTFHFTDGSGEPIRLNPGNTWVELAENLGDDAFIVAPDVDPATVTDIPTFDLRDPATAPTDITIRFPEVSEADST
jgi:Protein of unknown function (DUF3048) N-terminal domain/Protein of unknown function (DUF3048) C-terminal domain